MSKLNWWRTSFALFLLWAATALALPAQTLATLHSFDSSDGQEPQAGMVQATDGALFGTTPYGGASNSCDLGCGTIFKMTPSGTLTTVYSFCSQSGCTDGRYPFAALVEGADGNFYGTTSYGGATGGGGLGNGTVFKITPSGTLTTLHSFVGTDGAGPAAALVQAADGSFYGTTESGGINGSGTVFKITPMGMLTTLHKFDRTDGAYPAAALVQATNGNFYGTTSADGANGGGTVFEITPGGILKTLYNFCSIVNSDGDCVDGELPIGGLLQATDGNFYGTTLGGGVSNSCPYPDVGCGTVFKITPNGALTTLHNFDFTDGDAPFSGLVQGTNGNFYGTTYYGGANGLGTVFKIRPSGTLTTLYSFCSQSSCTDGQQPYAGLVQDTSGKFYGTTIVGGLDGDGTIFSLSVGLGPFVRTSLGYGKVGAAVKILGTNLTGATSVTFNGTPATFTVELPSVIKATVPAGATTGTLQVVTPNGTLSSNVPFRVAP